MSAPLSIPELAGRLLLDEPSRRAASRDFGRHVTPLPLAVVEPASIDDVVAALRFARRHGLPLSARGQAHSTSGQALVEGGLLLDMRSLAKVHAQTPDSVLVDAGARWSTVLDHTLPEGRTPPTLADYQELTVGGTLSVGGVGGETHQHGAQVDNVLELEVVTGAGERVVCSPDHEPELFHACLGGLGQVAILCRARLRLVEAPRSLCSFVLAYDAPGPLLADLAALSAEARFQHLYANVTALDAGGFHYELVATHHDREGHARDPAALLAGLSFRPGAVVAQPSSYRDFVHRVDAYAEAMKQLGLWDLPHPWLDLFVPSGEAEAFLAAELERLTPALLGRGGILLYPLERARCKAPLFALPDAAQSFLLDVFRNAAPPAPETVAAQVEQNLRAYRDCLARGGTLYPIGSTPMTPPDWARHFGAAWARLEAAKQRFDPDGILTPGPGIFR